MSDEDEDDDAILGVGSDHSFQDPADSTYEGGSKSPGFMYSMRSNHHSRMSYARRPSGTNTHSTVPYLHSRSSSGTFSGHVQGIPRSAPLHSHSSTEDEDIYSDFGLSSRDDDFFDSDLHSLPQSAPGRHGLPQSDKEKSHKSVTKAKRSRNRTSLPAYFSLLQVAGGSGSSPSSPKAEAPEGHRPSPTMSSSSCQTAARPSPPTPRLSVAGLSAGLTSIVPRNASIQATPRGRRRDLGDSSSLAKSRRSESSSSRSRSNSRTHDQTHTQATLARLSPAKLATHDAHLLARSRLNSKGSLEQVLDWVSVSGLPPRGRAAVRRNSSPPPKMLQTMMPLEDFTPECGAFPSQRMGHASETVSSSPGRRSRGRARVDELEGVGGSVIAPGYGHGRSGLIDRERGTRRAGRFR